MKRTVIDTEDNSKTLLIDDTEVTYHSRHGAITESTHIFLNGGLNYYPEQNLLRIFEMGFGTGLNALLSANFAVEQKKEIIYHTIEKYPLSTNEVEVLTSAFVQEHNTTLFNQIHACDWGSEILINPSFTIKKIREDLVNYAGADNFYDVVFFDAFGPKFQPKLWQPEILKKMFTCLKKGGILITYCAQGQFKRDLKSVGFTVENLPGPPGKREITRAIKP